MSSTADTGNNNNTDHYQQLNITNDDNTINYTRAQQLSAAGAGAADGIDSGNLDYVPVDYVQVDYEPVDYEPVDTLNSPEDHPADQVKKADMTVSHV